MDPRGHRAELEPAAGSEPGAGADRTADPTAAFPQESDRQARVLSNGAPTAGAGITSSRPRAEFAATQPAAAAGASPADEAPADRKPDEGETPAGKVLPEAAPATSPAGPRRRNPKEKAEPVWNKWSGAIEIAATAVEAWLDQALSQEMRVVGERVDEGEELAEATQNLTFEVRQRFAGARRLISDFLAHPQSAPLIRPSLTELTPETFEFRVFDPETQRVKSLPELVTVRETEVGAILDPQGWQLPTKPQQARTQVCVRLTDLAAESEEEILDRKLGLEAGEEKILRESAKSPEAGQQTIHEIERALAAFANIWTTKLEIGVRSAHYEEPVFEGRRGRVRYQPMVGIRFLHMIDGSLRVEMTNEVLSGLETSRPIQKDIPEYVGPEEEEQLQELFGAIHHSILEKMPVSRSGRKPVGKPKR